MSNPSKGSRRSRPAFALLAAGALVLGALTAVSTATAAESAGSTAAKVSPSTVFKSGNYIVLMRAPSATQYAGGVKGFSATRVAAGRNFNARSTAVRRYTAHLRGTHDGMARAVGAKIVRHYTVASNGFAAKLTGKQAFKLSIDKRVLAVVPDSARKVDTWNTPTFLGLRGRNGAWAQHGGRSKAGDGTVIGVLDTGIWPERKSFAGAKLTAKRAGKWDIARSGETTRMEKKDGGLFRGRCQLSAVIDGTRVAAEDWNINDCNRKLIGARYYPNAFVDGVDPADRSPYEHISTRDGDGHGSHTASTAGGNAVKNVSVEGVHFGNISGMAPAARIAAYKVCWEDNDPDTGGCYTSGTLEAIDDAVSDNVDAINYSISGAVDTVVDPVEIAFEGAAAAGIFVAVSAGNDGPDASTVAHPSPWVTTVAAATHHNFLNTVVLGNGKKYRGASISDDPVSSHRLVYAGDIAVGGDAGADAALCAPDSLDPAKAAGKIVFCDRGVYDRVAKSAEVKRAGGVAMILGNVSPNSLDADFHAVPTIHVSDPDAAAIKAYIAANPTTATARFVLGDTTGKKPIPLPVVAGFSSRGPSAGNQGDLLKPDIAAPGVSVLAAVAPGPHEGRHFDLISGTSMASPHIAGLGAFMASVHPRWTPMQIKSAMMTTAYRTRTESGRLSRDAFAQGAGHVNPRRFFNPGLFVTSSQYDWQRFLVGQGFDIGIGVSPLAANALNVPSIAEGEMTGPMTFRRTFQSTMKGTWRVSVSLRGFKVQTAKSLRFDRAGVHRRLGLRVTRTTAPFGSYTQGFVTLTGPTKVRLPIVIRPVALAVPDTVFGEGTSGEVDVTITSGFTGSQHITTTGLDEAEIIENTVAEGDFNLECVDVPANTELARFDLDAANDAADLDMVVFSMDDAGCTEDDIVAEVGASETGAADESVDLVDPPAGRYAAAVIGFAAAPGADSVDYRLDFYEVQPTDNEGNLTITPNPVPVTAGRQSTFTVSWTGLDANSRYLGWLDYDNTDLRTYLYVDTAG